MESNRTPGNGGLGKSSSNSSLTSYNQLACLWNRFIYEGGRLISDIVEVTNI